MLVQQFTADPKRWASQLTKLIRELDALGASLDDVRGAGQQIATWRHTRALNWLTTGGHFVELVAGVMSGGAEPQDQYRRRSGAAGGAR